MVVVQQEGQDVVVLLDQSHLKDEGDILNKWLLIIDLVTFILRKGFWCRISYIDFELAELLHDIIVPPIYSIMERIPHHRIFRLKIDLV